MAAAAQPIRLDIPGPSPYGFRLFGGDGEPLAVAKLRVKSKAYEIGLREGDVILGIDGRSCQSISHADAMALLEAAVSGVELQVLRDVSDREAIRSAFTSLGSALRPPTPVQSLPTDAPIKTSALGSPNIQHLISKDNNATTVVTTGTSKDNNTTTVVTTGTSKENIGGLTITKVSKQVTTTQSFTNPPFLVEHAEHEKDKLDFLQRSKENPTFEIRQGEGAPELSHLQETIVYRHVPNAPPQQNTVPARDESTAWNARTPKPYAAPPSNGPKPYAAPNPDEDDDPFITGPPLKPCDTAVCLVEEVAGSVPPAVAPIRAQPRGDESLEGFRVTPTPARPWMWQPTQQFRVVSQPMDEFQLDADQVRNAMNDETILAKHSPGGQAHGGEEDPDDIPLHLVKILTTIEDVDPGFFRKKKIFADSSFYDDPEHKYPTIEEQIKMSRKVALSLTAPGNTAARGQRMFMKRQEKSKFWSIDNPAYQRQSEGEDLYYNPTPWKSIQKHPVQVQWGKKVDVPAVFKKNDFRSKLRPVKKFDAENRTPKKFDPSAGKKFDPSAGKKKSGGGSYTSGSSGQKVSFSMSDELLRKKGRGGELFAKRRAKSEETEDSEPPKQWSVSVENLGQEHQAQCRLKDMIKENNAHPSPWDAGRRYEEVTKVTFGSTNGPRGEGVFRRSVTTERVTEGDAGVFQGVHSKLTLKSSGGYGPVRFKAPHVFGSMPAGAQTQNAEEIHQAPTRTRSEDEGGISDF